MTIIEAINTIDALYPNTYPQEKKIEQLSKLDGVIKREIIDKHEGADKEKAISEYIKANVEAYEKSVTEYMKVNEVTYEEAKKHVEFHEIKYKEAKEHIEATRNDIMFNGYDEKTPHDTVLLVPAPYDEVYVFWLQTWIDYWNGEIGRYNNSTSMYKSAYSNFERAYNREHMPKATKITYF